MGVFAILVLAFVAPGLAQRSRSAPETGSAAGQTLAEGALALEFDLSSDAGGRGPGGAGFPHGVEVGYFDGPTLFRTARVPNDRIGFSGRTARITVPVFPVPAIMGGVTLKLRALSTGKPGPWGAGVGPVEFPRIAARRRAPRDARARVATAAELDRRPELRDAVEALGQGMPITQVLNSFRNVRDLAVAVVLSRKHGLPFPSLCRAVADAPNKSLVVGVGKMAAALDMNRAIEDVAVEVKVLLSSRAPRRATPGK